MEPTEQYSIGDIADQYVRRNTEYLYAKNDTERTILETEMQRLLNCLSRVTNV